MAGDATRSRKIEVGYFAQHQIDELTRPRRPTSTSPT